MRILIIGLGSIGRKHIASLQKNIIDVQIIALRSSKNATLVDGVNNIFFWEEIHNFGRLDFAIISNPTSEHVSAIEKLIEHNIPLFIEKPLYNSIVESSLIEKIQLKGLITYIACNLRFLDCLQKAKSIISLNKINEVNVYCGSYLPEWRPGIDFRTIYSAIPELGGGVHIDLIHEIDYVYWLFGSPNNTNSTFTNKSSLNIRAIDYANYLFEYNTFSASIILNYYRRDYKRTLEFITEDSTYLVDLYQNTIKCDGEIIFVSEQRIIDTYDVQMNYFLDCIKHGKNTFNSIDIANNILKICLKNDIKR